MGYVPLATFAVGAILGWYIETLRDDSRALSSVTKEIRSVQKKLDTAITASQEFEKQKVKTEIRYVNRTKEILKYVDRPVYLQQCIDADGLRSLNSQINRAETADSSVP